jgi:hypothetical protein
VKFGFGTPFEEQLDFFRQKLNLPTERWNDITLAAHDRAFIVAGAMKADLLADLRGAVDKAIASGTGLEAFRKDFKAIVAKHGWTGWTGEGTAAGEAWRTKVIYQTNMAMSYEAGRYRQHMDPEFLKTRPYWQYIHDDSVMHPRPLHLAWNGLVLPYDHPFWKTHRPKNGWGCHCTVFAVRKSEYEKAKITGKSDPPVGWNTIDPKSGTPIGIDKGFDYAPGASVHKPLKDFIDQKLIKLDAPIGAAMWEVLQPVMAREMGVAVSAMVATTAETMQAAGNAALVGVVAPETVKDLAIRGVPLETADIWLRDAELLHALRQTKDARGATLPLDVWQQLPSYLADATPYLDTHDTALVYAFDLPDGVGKVLVRVNYGDKVKQAGKRTRLTSNFVRTGGVIEAKNIEVGTQYVELVK